MKKLQIFLRPLLFFISEHACKDFRCAQVEYCISPDLLCDQVNHCSDGSDEGVSANCKSKP